MSDKATLFALMPDVIRSRCASFSIPCIEPSWKFFASASLAIVLGATTHVFWDSFTHRGRWGTHLFPRLNANVVTIGLIRAGLQSPTDGARSSCSRVLCSYSSVGWQGGDRPLGGLPTLPRFWRVSACVMILLIPTVVATFVWTWISDAYMSSARPSPSQGRPWELRFSLTRCSLP